MKFSEYLINEISQAAINKAIQKFVKAGHEEDEVTKLVNAFNDLSIKKKIKSVDIFQLSFDDLKKIVKDAQQTTSRSEKEKIIKDKETEFVYENDKVLIVSPLTHESSCKYGSQTRWCTTQYSDTHWMHYYQQGDKLYYIIPKDGGDKIAIKVDIDGYMEIYSADDNILNKNNVMHSLVDDYDIDADDLDMFQPLDRVEAHGRMMLTDEQIDDLAYSFLQDLKFGKDEEIGKKALKIIKDYISNMNDYDLETNMEEFAKNEIEEWYYAFTTALEELGSKYGIDDESDNNKLILLPYLSTDYEQTMQDVEDDFYSKGWDFLDNEGFIRGLDINFTDNEGLSKKELDSIEKWLEVKYKQDNDDFDNFYDDFLIVAKDKMQPVEKVSEVIEKQIKDLIDKVSKVEYGKAGHPKLDLQSRRIKMNQFEKLYEAIEKKYTTARGVEVSDPAKIQKVIYILKAKQAKEADELARRMVEIKQKETELKELRQTCEIRSREMCEALSVAGDEVLTRVMETAETIIAISGLTQRVDVNWRGAFKQMADEFAPDIVKKMNKIVKMYTGDPKDVVTRVTPSIKGEAFGDWVSRVGDSIKGFLRSIKSWGMEFDKRLDDFQKKYGIASKEEK